MGPVKINGLAALHAHDGVIVVPPMEAVWLAGAEWELRDGRGCLSFEVKGARELGWRFLPTTRVGGVRMCSSQAGASMRLGVVLAFRT